MTNALITLLESPALPLKFEVTGPAAAVLMAGGWTPPTTLAEQADTMPG